MEPLHGNFPSAPAQAPVLCGEQELSSRSDSVVIRRNSPFLNFCSAATGLLSLIGAHKRENRRCQLRAQLERANHLRTPVFLVFSRFQLVPRLFDPRHRVVRRRQGVPGSCSTGHGDNRGAGIGPARSPAARGDHPRSRADGPPTRRSVRYYPTSPPSTQRTECAAARRVLGSDRQFRTAHDAAQPSQLRPPVPSSSSGARAVRTHYPLTDGPAVTIALE